MHGPGLLALLSAESSLPMRRWFTCSYSFYLSLALSEIGGERGKKGDSVGREEE